MCLHIFKTAVCIYIYIYIAFFTQELDFDAFAGF